MKFDLEDCWKHKNCMDVFFFVNCAYQDDGKTARLVGHWMTQGVDHHWMVSDQESFLVNENEYDNWERYTPKGMFK